MFKRVFLASLLLGCLSLSGSGAQSNSLILQAGSFIGILISLVILFFFMKMISKSMGCLPSFLILCAITLFIMYSFGMLDKGISGIPDAIRVFLGQKPATQPNVDPVSQIVQQAQMNMSAGEQATQEVAPLLPQTGQAEQVGISQQAVENTAISPEEILPPITKNDNANNLPVAPIVQEENDYDKIFAETESAVQVNMDAAPQQEPVQQQQQAQGPINLLAQLPLLMGPARILDGDTLHIQGRNIVLFGIDAPELSQTCTNKRGQSYNCGREAALWLKDWLGNHEIQCRIMKEDKRGNLMGVCMAGDYDIAAALVNAGLAFADTNVSDIYVPYQEQARANARGLWNGNFYMPWDWRRMQSQKANIKVIKKTKKKKGILDL